MRGFARSFLATGTQAWLTSGRVHLTPVDPLSLSAIGEPLPSPFPNAGARDYLQLDDPDRMLVLDVDASGVEVWSLPQAALLRQIRGFHAVGAPPAWDRWSGWWWIPTSTGLVAVDPDYKQPVRELALPDAVVAVLPIGPREVAVMLQRAGGVAVVVLDHAHGAQVGRVVPLPQWQGGRAMAVLHEGL